MLGNNDLKINETLMPVVKKCVFKQSYDYWLLSNALIFFLKHHHENWNAINPI